ncbi:cyclin-like protein [Peniophora sp. CONT]|nr:cyclin-like protein [Peniophora sp. CONT]
MSTQPFPLAMPQGPEQPYYGPDLSVRLICPDCRDPNPYIVEEFSSGDLVCGTCGLVLGDRVVDTRSEWRTFSNDEPGDDPSRVGAASDPVLGLEHLDTIIGFKDGGSGVSSELKRAAARAQGSHSARSIPYAFHEISSMCDQCSLNKHISDIAKQAYKRCEDEKLLRGKPVEAIIAACIFIACRYAGVPRTFREIGQIANVPKKLLGQCFRTLQATLNLQQTQTQNGQPGPGRSGPEDMLVRYCNYLDLPPYAVRYCRDVIVAAREYSIADGRNPMSIAGGAIVFACQLLDIDKPLKDIADVAGVSADVINSVYKSYLAEKEKLVKKEWLESGRAKMERLRLEPGPVRSTSKQR